MRFNIGCKSIWSWSDSVEKRNCAADDKNDILTDKLVTYSKYDSY